MRPVSLAFSGLNSYREKQTIDFSALSAYGIFGIFGPTGSGKSSILDAITLALYGEVERAAHDTKGIINLEEKQCLVDFTFLLGDKKYCAQRVLERKKDDLFSANTKSCRLYIVDEEKVLADKAKEMTAKIEELLGMDFARFTQTVILPQGKFDRFLRLPPTERANMMEDIFHLEEYGETLNKKAKNRLAVLEEKLRLLAARREGLGDCSEEIIDRQTSELKACKDQLIAAQEKKEAAELALSLARQWQEKAAALEKAQKELALLDLAEQDMSELEIGLERAKKAEPLRLSLEKAKENYKLLQEAISLSVQKDTAAKQAQEEEKSASDKRKHAEEELQKRRAHLGEKIARLEAAKEKEEQLQALKTRIKELRQKLDPLQGEAKRLLAEQMQKEKAASDLRLKYLRWKDKEEILYKKWQEEDADLRQRQRREMAAYLASSLEEGEACPVCGSLHHPGPAPANADLPAWDEAQKFLQESMAAWREAGAQAEDTNQALQKSLKDAQDLSARLNENEKLSAACHSSIAEAEMQLQGLEAALQEVVGDLSIDEAQGSLRREWNALESSFSEARRLEEEKRNIAITINNQSIQAAAKRETLENSLARLQEELSAGLLAAGFASANEALKALLPSEELRKAEKELAEYKQRRESLRILIAGLESELKKAGYAPGLAEEKAQEAESLTAIWQDLIAQEAVLNDNLLRLSANRKLWQELEQKRAALTKQSELVKRLTALIKGKAFVRFLARENLQEIVGIASRTLGQLTGQRYRLELFEDSRGSDFIMVDNYSGGLRRQVGTLSGGEIFIVSLALALALSHKIQMQGKPLGFFFLDEGFGALDAQKLETVMDILEHLPSDSRMVGVITHVQEVKNRLPLYLEVSPAKEGKGSLISLGAN